MKLHVVSNDSTVFLRDQGDVSEIFGGRYTEIRNFCNRASVMYEVKISVISGKYGLITSPHCICKYKKITDSKEDYIRLEKKFCYSRKIWEESESSDVLILFVPKDMTKIILQQCNSNCKVITVTNFAPENDITNPDLYLIKRKGARIGKKNEQIIFEILQSIDNQIINPSPSTNS